jgi:DtxR family Mn-dependent transcriptional regulator
VERPSPAVQDYLKAIFLLGEAPAEDAVVTTSRVAESLGVTAPSASNMLRRLEEMGYVRAGRGAEGRASRIELTDDGRAAALEVVRHHRLLETFLATRLGMSWDEVHREAEVLEHHISAALASRIDDALGHPERDPHGHPIPTAAGDVAAVTARTLADLEVGAAATVTRVSDRDSALLRYLAERGLVPDAAVEVLAAAPFGGPLSVRTATAEVEVPPDAARAVYVE